MSGLKRATIAKAKTTRSPVFDPDKLDKPIVWKSLFGKDCFPEIEVGSGKGTFLLARAREYPETSFIGLEFANAYLRTFAERVRKRGIENVRVARYEAGRFFRESVPDQSLGGFHLLYPDPWPKKRHNKRRLVQDEFLAELRRTLRPGAFLNIATDHSDYFEWMLEHFDRWKGTFGMEPRVLSTPKSREGYVGRTNYEIKYLASGRTIHLLTGKRTGF